MNIGSDEAAWDIERSRRLSGTWLADDEFRKHVPNHAIVGLGVLRGNNRLVQEAKSDPRQRSPSLNPIYPLLEKLVQDIDFVQKKCISYCPVADFCNSLFVILPAKTASSDVVRVVEEDIRRTIESINKHLLTITYDQIRCIENVMLVARTLEKAPGIYQLLTEKEGAVSGICVDKAAAEYVLAMKSG